MNKTIGTCSHCGGPVQVPTAWYGINPPVPTCGHCGATARPAYGPVIPMTKPMEKTPSRISDDFKRLVE